MFAQAVTGGVVGGGKVDDAAAELVDFGDDGGGVDVEGRVARHCKDVEDDDEVALNNSMACERADAHVPSTNGMLSTLERNLYMPNVGLQDMTALH